MMRMVSVAVNSRGLTISFSTALNFRVTAACSLAVFQTLGQGK